MILFDWFLFSFKKIFLKNDYVGDWRLRAYAQNWNVLCLITQARLVFYKGKLPYRKLYGFGFFIRVSSYIHSWVFSPAPDVRAYCHCVGRKKKMFYYKLKTNYLQKSLYTILSLDLYFLIYERSNLGTVKHCIT